MEFRQTKEKIDSIVDEWLDEWKKPVIDDHFSTEVDLTRKVHLGPNSVGPKKRITPIVLIMVVTKSTMLSLHIPN